MRSLLFASLLLVGCGAKTGLLVPDSGPDGGMDAGVNDAGMCMDQPVALTRRGAQIMFVVDRSNSMDDTIDGRDAEMVGEPSRWQELAAALALAFAGADPLLEVGAKFYPNADETMMGPEAACMVDEGIDLEPARDNVMRLLAFFASTDPLGGTPTAEAIREVRDFFARRPAPGVPRFVVLATDGGPNCNPDTGVPPDRCVCTGGPNDCASSPEFGPYNCLDDLRTVQVVEEMAALGVPVYVIGIDDPTRPDLGDVLDRMAVAGGRPRMAPGERQFYSVRERDDLRSALDTITGSIAQCVFTVEPAVAGGVTLEVRVDDRLIPRDGSRLEGWDFTTADRSEITLFGGACRRVTEAGGEVTATIDCER